jgi:hypothetical protein
VTPDLDDPWLARRYYGGDLPAEAERYLHLAARHYCDDAVAEAHLAAAERIAPGHQAVDLGHYKYCYCPGSPCKKPVDAGLGI